MAYCTVADVESLTGLKFIISGRPSTSNVQDDIDDIAAVLDGYIQAAGYTLPITGAAAVSMLKSVNKKGAACAAWHTGYVSQALAPRAEFWCSEYTTFKEDLRDGKVQLPGEEPESDLDPAFGIVQQPPRDRYWTYEDEPLETQ